jgi:Fe/S biogenesis protein NfuA
MIQISESAQAHFRRLIEREDLPGLGVRLAAVHAGTPRADVRLEFAEPGDLAGDEWAVDCEGFTVWVDAASVQYLDGADIDYVQQATGGQLQIRAPKIKGEAPAESASLVERVRWIVEHEINPQLAQHRGHVSVQEVTGDGVVVLRFGGGCHGCGMADVTLKQGIEKTLLTRVPGVTAVRDATDHASGEAPYIRSDKPRDAA